MGTMTVSPIADRFATIILVPNPGTILLACGPRLCEAKMRLIGRPDLVALANGEGGHLRDAIHALAAEVTAANWDCIDDVRRAFPLARFVSNRLVVDLDGHHCAVFAINYEKGIALVEFTGATLNFDSLSAPKAGKRK